MSSPLIVKKRRPINKKEAKFLNQALIETHDIDFSIQAGKYEKGICDGFDVVIQYGHVFALIMDDICHLSVRGLLSHEPKTGWVQVDMGAVPFVCNGANVMSAGINDASIEIGVGQYVWIREENHHKPLGVGKVIMNREEMIQSEKGKAIQALHYIGDKIWTYGVKE